MFKRLRTLVAPPAAPARGMSGAPPLLRNGPPAVEQCAALLAGQHITYTLKRSNRRRSIGLRIDDRGLTVNAPLRASERWLHSVLQEKARWVLEKLDGWQQRKPAEIRWVEGETIPFLGELLTLRVRQSLFAAPPILLCEASGTGGGAMRPFPHQRASPHRVMAAPPILLCEASGTGGGAMRPFPHQRASPHRVMAAPARCCGKELWVFVTDCSDIAHIEQVVSHWYRQQAEKLFSERVAHFAPLLNVTPRMIKLSAAKTQWGSCTARGTVRLNEQLVRLPLRLIDYVVVHELAHMREMNHSAAFWNVVGSVCPDYAKLRRELKAVAL